MEYGKFSISFTYISPWGPKVSFGGRTRSYNCALVWYSSKHVCFTRSPTSHLRLFMNTFLSHPWPYTHTHTHTHDTSAASQAGIGQCLLLQTSSLATCVSTLGGLPNGLGTLWPGPACANIFLMRVNRKSLWHFLTPRWGMKNVAVENGQV